MKKKLTIPLLLLVLLIWGWIFYKIIHAAEDTLPMPVVSAKVEKKEMADTASDSVGHYQPKGGYPDPFLSGIHAVAAEEVENLEMTGDYNPPPEEVYVDWSMIKYLGEVKNPGTKKSVILLGVNEKDFMMKVGETNEGVTLLQNTATYIKIKYQGQENVLLKEAVAEPFVRY